MPDKPFFQTRTGKLIITVSCFCGLLLLMIWTQLTTQLQNDQQHTIEAAIQRNSNLAVSLEQYTIRTLRNADAVLQLVKKEFEDHGGKIDFPALFGRGVIDVDYFNGVFILDAEGKMMLSNLSLETNSTTEFSDRQYFSFHRQQRDSLFISTPLVSRTIGKPVIVVSRRINKPDGTFNGVVAVQIEPSTITGFYAKADLHKNDIISLISLDGITYARRTGKVESQGEDISASPLFSHVYNKPVGTYFAEDVIHYVPTYFSYRKLEKYPVIATVGSAKSDILLDYHRRERREYTFGVIISFLLVMFSILICTLFADRKKYVRRVKASEARYRSIVENSQEGIIVIRNDGTIDSINEAGQRAFRLESLAPEAKLENLFASATPSLNFTPSELESTCSLKAEISFTRHDGTSFIGEISQSAYRDTNGSQRSLILIRDISFRKQMEQRLLSEQKRYQREMTKQIILAQEKEREVIGYELHDNVNQMLTTVKLFLDMAHTNPEMRKELLPRSIHLIQDCISEIRNLSHKLSAPTLGTQSLIDSIKALVETVETSGCFSIHFQYSNYHTHLEKDQRITIYRILQEQLNNIIKHAKATEVSIYLMQCGEFTEIIVQDNGSGFNPAERKSGIGFNNMRSRTKVFGGKLLVESSPGCGCTVRIVLPILCKREELMVSGM